MNEVKNLIGAVLRTMDKITITGTENMNKFLGCYQYLEKCVQKLEYLENEAALQDSVATAEAGEE